MRSLLVCDLFVIGSGVHPAKDVRDGGPAAFDVRDGARYMLMLIAPHGQTWWDLQALHADAKSWSRIQWPLYVCIHFACVALLFSRVRGVRVPAPVATPPSDVHLL